MYEHKEKQKQASVYILIQYVINSKNVTKVYEHKKQKQASVYISYVLS